MKKQNLLVTSDVRNKTKRSPIRPKPHAEYPNHYWGIDIIKIKMAGWGWLYLTVVLDWYTKEIIGYNLGLQSRTEDWLKALYQAVNSQFPKGILETEKEQLFLISDNGYQPTSQRFMMNCACLGIKQIFTTWSDPKDNSDIERVLRTIKENIVWPYEWDNPFDFEIALSKGISDYNSDFPHQTLNNMTPIHFYQSFANINKEPVLT